MSYIQVRVISLYTISNSIILSDDFFLSSSVFVYVSVIRKAYHFRLLLYNAILKISTIRLCVSNRKYCLNLLKCNKNLLHTCIKWDDQTSRNVGIRGLLTGLQLVHILGTNGLQISFCRVQEWVIIPPQNTVGTQQILLHMYEGPLQ